jgi:hypothetical protein
MQPVAAEAVRIRQTDAPNAPCVLCSGDQFKMGRVHAVADVAAMIQDHPVGDRADQQLPNETVRQAAFPSRALGIGQPATSAIAAFVNVASPEPAAGLRIDMDPGGDPFRQIGW